MGTDRHTTKTSYDFKLIHMNLTCHDDMIIRISSSFLQLIKRSGVSVEVGKKFIQHCYYEI